MTKNTWLFFAFLLASLTCISQPQKQVVYKTIDTTQLSLNFYFPENFDPGKTYPAMLFFFGGGWVGGDPGHLAPQAEYFAKRGLICICADYRTKNKNGTSPFESLKDARSAMRFVRKNANQFHIDPNKIIASGGSAGGHLAAACALVDGYNDEQDDLSIDVKPNALVLFNPVIDNGPGGYGFERVGESYRSFSPLHNIHEGAPPTIFFLGTEDRLIPVETAQYYKKVMERVGSRCDLFLYEGQGHGFFNYGKDHFEITVREAGRFLVSLGYLKE
jgi:acetyl esterase/lipase